MGKGKLQKRGTLRRDLIGHAKEFRLDMEVIQPLTDMICLVR